MSDISLANSRRVVKRCSTQHVIDPDYQQQAAIPMRSDTHSDEGVAVYAKGPWANLFDGTAERNYIFHVMKYAIFAQ